MRIIWTTTARSSSEASAPCALTGGTWAESQPERARAGPPARVCWPWGSTPYQPASPPATECGGAREVIPVSEFETSIVFAIGSVLLFVLGLTLGACL